MPPSWVEYLAKAGFDAVHWSQIGPGNANDAAVMKWAVEHNQIVLTSDLDFGAILAATHGLRPSVILIRDDVPIPAVMGAAVLAAIEEAQRELSEGALVSVDLARARLRVLPLRD